MTFLVLHQHPRQFSHRLSSLEKATHDPTSFQYADPLEGRATIVAGRGNVVGANVAGSSNVATTSVGGANVTETENVGDIGATIDSGASYSALHQFPAAPATGGLNAMEIGRAHQPNSAAETETATGTSTQFTVTPTNAVQPSAQPANATVAQTMDDASTANQVVQPQPSSLATPSPAKMTPAKPTPTKPSTATRPARKLHLPIPKKANLPLPPPLPSRIKKPPSSGNSLGLSLGSKMTGASGVVILPFASPRPWRLVHQVEILE